MGVRWIVCFLGVLSLFSLSKSLSIPFDESLLSAHGECFGDFKPSFVRISGLVSFKPQFIAKIDMVTCASHCRRNIDPSSRDHFGCQGFNFHPGRIPTCEFFPIENSEESKEPQWRERDFAYYYEKTCLKIPPHCESSTFIFDVRRNFKLKATAEKLSDIKSPSDCQEECIRRECSAFQFERKTKECSIYDRTRRESEGETAADSDYYENNCLPHSSRCNGGRVEFFVVRKSDVASFGISAGIRSVRNCMRECVESSLFFCRSFQFDPITNECFVSDESSDLAVPSVSLDLYEPFCVPSHLEIPCNRPYAFEKKLTTKLLYNKEIATLKNVSTESCLTECVENKLCQSINYDVSKRDCVLLSNRDKVEGARTGMDENFDYFELACEPTFLAETTRAPDTKLIENERSIRAEFRNLQHVHILNYDECRSACQKAPFGCHSFAYSPSRGECQLSKARIERGSGEYERHSRLDKDFDLFAMNRKRENEKMTISGASDVTKATPEESTFPTLFQESDILTAPIMTTLSNRKPFEEDIDNAFSEENIFAVATSTVFGSVSDSTQQTTTAAKTDGRTTSDESTTTTMSRNSEQSGASTSLEEKKSKTDDVIVFGAKKKLVLSGGENSGENPSPLREQRRYSSAIALENEDMKHSRKKDSKMGKERDRVVDVEDTLDVFVNGDSPNSSLHSNSNETPTSVETTSASRKPSASFAIDPESEETSEDVVPRVVPLTANVGHVSPDSVKVRAECHENGVNVTFDVTEGENDYTGAVYAAERFTQCRIFVKNSRSFAIFLPRPEHNSWCNALEVNGILSAVIVMSNDRVLPHDVTTKDDLFYQVTCNYSITQNINKVQSGIVVGGPSPVSIKSRQSRSFSLQIMQQGEPVESVFIGEKLTARVESDIPADNLRVTECTATRVGGEVTPATVQLIDDGCALMPSIMGPMKLGRRGWEATLNAFRIDGSEQIDIVCLVVVCQDEKCPEVKIKCPMTDGRQTRSTSTSTSLEPIRVDHRLKVLGGDRESWRRDSRTFPELCIQPQLYLSTLVFLVFCILAVICSTCVSIRRKKNDQKMAELLSSPPPSQYRRQLSL